MRTPIALLPTSPRNEGEVLGGAAACVVDSAGR